jgi:hypothetical protein
VILQIRDDQLRKRDNANTRLRLSLDPPNGFV